MIRRLGLRCRHLGVKDGKTAIESNDTHDYQGLTWRLAAGYGVIDDGETLMETMSSTQPAAPKCSVVSSRNRNTKVWIHNLL
jgi:hypothetical protein